MTEKKVAKKATKKTKKASTSKSKTSAKKPVNKETVKEKSESEIEGFKTPIKKDKSTMQKMLEVGLHFGHTSSRWNPKMQEYIYAERNNMHIIDLTQTIDLLNKACKFLEQAASEGEIIFVGTKKQAQEIVQTAAKKCGAYYVTKRWPGGFLTNFKTLKARIEKLNDLVAAFDKGIENRTKRELLQMKKQLRRLVGLYGGLRGIKKFPKAIVVVDTKVEDIAIREAQAVGIPVVALLDTNSDPDQANYIVPGNDDATKAIKLVVDTYANAVLKGNNGQGVKHEDVDFNMIDARIVNMLEEIRKKKEAAVKIEKDQPKVVKGKKVRIIRKNK